MDKKIYNNLVKNIELENIELLSLNCGQAPELKGGSVSVHTNFEVNEILETEKDIRFFVTFIVCAYKELANNNEKKDDEAQRLFDINFTYIVTYQKNDNNIYEKEYYEFFADRNIPINVWSYARELVSSVTTRMGLPTLILPTYKIIPDNKEK